MDVLLFFYVILDFNDIDSKTFYFDNLALGIEYNNLPFSYDD